MAEIETAHLADDCDHAFHGWLRLPGRRWQDVITGQTEAEAFSRLQELASQHQHVDLAVLVAGEKP